MAVPRINVGQELLNVPMGEMIKSMATSIAEAQWDLDKAAMVVTELMSGQRLLRDLETGELIDFEGNVVQPLEENGTIKRDRYGEPIYASDNGPRTVDSRIYFGYVYEPEKDSSGNVVLTQVTQPDGTVEQKPLMRRVPNRVSMMELGFTPSFYQFIDTVIEVKMAIKMSTRETSTTRTTQRSEQETTTSSSNSSRSSYGWSSRWWWWWSNNHHYSSSSSSASSRRAVETNVSTVDATYSQTYGYSVEGSSLLRTKLVPVPPPAILQDRIRALVDTEREYLANVAAGQLAPPAYDNEVVSGG